MQTILRMLILTLGLLGFWGNQAEAQPFTEPPIARLGKGLVDQIAYSPDGTLLAAGGSVGIWLYDATTLAEVGLLQGHTSEVIGIAFSPDGTLLASGGRDKTVRLWDVVQRREVAVLRGHTTDVRSVAFSPDGRFVASGSSTPESEVRVWDVEQRVEVAVLKGHTLAVWTVAFSPDGRLIASGSRDQTIRVWDVAQRKEVAVLRGHTDWVISVAFSPDGTLLASGSGNFLGLQQIDTTVRLWDVGRLEEVAVLRGHTGPVFSVVFSPDGKLLASASSKPEGAVRVWDVAQRKEVAVLRGGRTGEMASVSFSPDGRWLASSNADGVRVWDVRSYQEVASIGGYGGQLYAVAFDFDGRTLAAVGDDGNMHLWDVARRLEVAVFGGHTDWVWSVVFSPDRRLLASGGNDKTVRLWDVEQRAEVAILGGHTGPVGSVTFSPDGRLLASGGGSPLDPPFALEGDKTVRVWDVGRRWEVAVLKGHTGDVTSVAFSPDGRWLASGSKDSTVRVWDVAQRVEVVVLRGHTGPVSSVAFSPDGRWLASGSGTLFGPPFSLPGDGTVRVWDMARYQEVAVLTGAEVDVLSVVFSPDGRWLASGSANPLTTSQELNPTVRVWDVVQRQEVAVLRGHTNPVSSVVFSPDGRLLASTSSDGIVLLWGALPTAVEEDGQDTRGSLVRPSIYTLMQNVPNPFNPQTTIRYALPERAEIRLMIYDLTGRKVRILVQGGHQPGQYSVVWDGRDQDGQEVASGIYLYRLEVVGRGAMETRRMLLLR